MGGEKFKYLFNNFLISLAFLLQFTAYNGIGNLQVNKRELQKKSK